MRLAPNSTSFLAQILSKEKFVELRASFEKQFVRPVAHMDAKCSLFYFLKDLLLLPLITDDVLCNFVG